MSSVEIINSEEVRDELEGLGLNEMYEEITSSLTFRDLDRHLGGGDARTAVPVENGVDDSIDDVEIDPFTGRGGFEHYSEREFYVFAFQRESMEMYAQKSVPELIPKEELIGDSVDGVFTVADNGHFAMMTDFDYRSNWSGRNRNEVEAIYDAAEKVYSAITVDQTQLENGGYDIDVTNVQDELYDKLNSAYSHCYRSTIEKIAAMPENSNKGNTTRAAWEVNDVDRLLGHIDKENQKVVIEDIANHNKSSKNSRNHDYGNS